MSITSPATVQQDAQCPRCARHRLSAVSGQRRDINVDKSPTDDVNVRRALILATDQKQMIDTLFDDQYVPATQLLTPNTEGYDETLKTLYGTNLDKANQLLDQAGWKMGSDGVVRRTARSSSCR